MDYTNDQTTAPLPALDSDDEWRARLAEARARRKLKKQRRATAETSPLWEEINAAKRGSNHNLPALTVLATQNDPYRLATPAGQRDGEWFADAIARLVPADKQIHNRAVHYRVVSTGALAVNSHGKPYKNDDPSWLKLEHCSKAARWQRLVPFERITDARNEEPMLFTTQGVWLEGDDALSLRADVPSLEALAPERASVPRINLEGGRHHRQPNRIIYLGEKSSLREILEPIAKEVRGEVLLPTGESSDTMIFHAVARAAKDGRPLVVLYLADFDPSGWQMSISVARKIQGLRRLFFPNLKAQVHHLGLTREQAVEWGLPSTPLKEKELRKARWLETWGREQTEIDAAIAIVPEKLEKVIRDATLAFYDPTLQRRAHAVWSTWHSEEAARYYAMPIFTQAQIAIDSANEAIEEAHDEYLRRIDAAGEVQDLYSDTVNDLIAADPPSDPPVDDVEPILAPAPVPIFTTDDDYITATVKLKDRKALCGVIDDDDGDDDAEDGEE